MYRKEIKELMELFEKTQVSSMHYKDDKFELKLEKQSLQMVAPSLKDEPVTVQSTSKTVDAPLVGVFYSRPSKDQTPFVEVGSLVQKGDILCILEAMKVMNDIKATHSGVVKKIFFEDGEAVSFGDALFEIA